MSDDEQTIHAYELLPEELEPPDIPEECSIAQLSDIVKECGHIILTHPILKTLTAEELFDIEERWKACNRLMKSSESDLKTVRLKERMLESAKAAVCIISILNAKKLSHDFVASRGKLKVRRMKKTKNNTGRSTGRDTRTSEASDAEDAE